MQGRRWHDPGSGSAGLQHHCCFPSGGAADAGVYYQEKSKGHGTDQYLEGLANFSEGDKVVLLEDVCTTGGTLITAAERVRDAGLEIVGVLAVLDREEGGRENLKKAGLELSSIFTRQELLSAGGR